MTDEPTRLYALLRATPALQAGTVGYYFPEDTHPNAPTTGHGTFKVFGTENDGQLHPIHEDNLLPLKLATTLQARYTELQAVKSTPNEPEHEALHIQTEDDQWFAFYLPPGKTFGADIEIQDTTE